MFKNLNTIDIASEMESNLYKTAHEQESRVESKRIEAAHELSVAATAFEQAGLYKFAEISTILVERVLNGNASIEKLAEINNPDYTHYVIVNGKIESGWEYPEDAKDNAREILDNQPHTAVKIYSLRHLNKIGLDPDDDANWLVGPYADSPIISEAAKKKSKKPANKKVKKPKNPGKSKDEKEMYRHIGYDANDINDEYDDSPHGNAGSKGLYYGNAHLPGVYHKTHEGPGELAREEQELGLTEVPDIKGEEGLEDRFLDMILGGEEHEDLPEEMADITENNEADDINMINELFEDV